MARFAWRERVRLRQLASGHRNSRAHWLLFPPADLVAASVWDLGVFAAIEFGRWPPAHLLLGSSSAWPSTSMPSPCWSASARLAGRRAGARPCASARA